MKKEKEEIEDLKVNMMPVCIICSSRCNLMSFEANGKLTQLFRNITNIDVKDEMASASGNGICSECLHKLEDTSSFINLSLCNDGKLVYAIGRKEYVKCETYSDAIGINSSTSDGLKLEDVTDHNVELKENLLETTIFDEIEEKQGNIDIKEHNFETELSNSLSSTYRTELAIHSQKSTQKLFPKQDSVYLAEEEFSQFDWSNEDSTNKSDSRREMITNTKENFKCDLCGKGFIRKSNLQSHSLICTGEKPFECDYCEKSFIRKWDLKIHSRTHTGEKPFKCHCCKKCFTQSGDLKRHVRTHTGEKPFECECCEKSFIRRGDLKIHMQTHTGENRFKCDHCEKSFTQKGSLNKHLRSHTGEKPFKCNVCDKSFSQGGHLRYHMRTHTGEKPFKCNVCGKSFSQGGNLRTHMIIHSG